MTAEIITTIMTGLLQYALDRPEATGTLLVAIVGGGASYLKTGKLPIGRIPWRHLRTLVRDLGDKYFGVKRPKGVPGLVVDAKPADVMAALRPHFFESTDLYSYEYEGEAWGMRRPNGLRPAPKSGEPTPMELHPRGFETSDGRTLVIAHDEASRFEATGLHLDDSMLSWGRGRDQMEDVLSQRTDMAFEAVESERDAGIDVVG